MVKKWYLSRMLWANAIAGVAFFVQAQFGYVVDPVMQGYILAGINIILRFVTKDPIV